EQRCMLENGSRRLMHRANRDVHVVVLTGRPTLLGLLQSLARLRRDHAVLVQQLQGLDRARLAAGLAPTFELTQLLGDSHPVFRTFSNPPWRAYARFSSSGSSDAHDRWSASRS